MFILSALIMTAHAADARYIVRPSRHDRNTNRRMLRGRLGSRGPRVQLRSNHSGVVTALAMAVSLCGCANVDFDTSQAWFAKPLDLAGRNAGGYSFSELAESKQRQRQITPSDLVDSNGACPPPATRQAPPATPGNQAATPAAPANDAAYLLGAGVALGMSECDVVFRAGQPTAVQVGKNPNGDRIAVLTYKNGPRPGIYHFERGELMEMDRVEEPSAPAAPAQSVKKKSAKSNKPQKKNDQT